MSYYQSTYHVMHGNKRTTISVEVTLSIFLAFKLKVEPLTAEAHNTIRKFLQEKLNEANYPGRNNLSQWVRDIILLEVVDKKLSALYWDWYSADRMFAFHKKTHKEKRRLR